MFISIIGCKNKKTSYNISHGVKGSKSVVAKWTLTNKCTIQGRYYKVKHTTSFATTTYAYTRAVNTKCHPLNPLNFPPPHSDVHTNTVYPIPEKMFPSTFTCKKGMKTHT